MIAVCIATYNHEAFIAQAIDSVQMQQCDEPIRIYIGDDASTDRTQTICERYAAQDERIVYPPQQESWISQQHPRSIPPNHGRWL